MRNPQTLANRDFAIRERAMRRLYDYGEGTGSVIDEEQSDSFQRVPRVWELLPRPPTPRSATEDGSGTELN